jgi:hypothetical protein
MPGGRVSDELIAFHRRVAAGGVAMTTVAYLAVSPEGRTDRHCLLLNAESLPGLRQLTDAVHAEGTAASAQIGHAGPVANARSTRAPALSPSAGFTPMGSRLRAVDAAGIERITEDYRRAALVAVEAGFDALEIHVGHNAPGEVHRVGQRTATGQLQGVEHAIGLEQRPSGSSGPRCRPRYGSASRSSAAASSSPIPSRRPTSCPTPDSSSLRSPPRSFSWGASRHGRPLSRPWAKASPSWPWPGPCYASPIWCDAWSPRPPPRRCASTATSACRPSTPAPAACWSTLPPDPVVKR